MIHTKSILAGVALLLSLSGTQALAGTRNEAIIGGLLGGGAGAAIGHHIHGRNGAIIGGALGGAAGVAIATPREVVHERVYVREEPRYYHAPRERVRYRPEPRHEWHRDHDRHHDHWRQDDRRHGGWDKGRGHRHHGHGHGRGHGHRH